MSSVATTAPLLGEPLPIELMNTVWADRSGVHEALDSAAAAAAWLQVASARQDASWPSLPAELDLTSSLSALVGLRDAGRALAARQTADDREPALSAMDVTEALRVVNDLAASAPAYPSLRWGAEEPELVLETDRPIAATVVAELARATVEFFGGSYREGLRACQAPGCVLYFVKEHPRREWCSAGCGNRARVARHYRRHSGRATD